MIRLIRLFFHGFVISFLLQGGFPESFAEAGGNGVRNGGSGVICTSFSGRVPVTLERFNTASIAGLGPAGLQAEVLERFRRVNPTFASEVAARLAIHGPARSWPKWSERESSAVAPPSENSGRAYTAQFAEALAWLVGRFDAAIVRPWGGSLGEAHLSLMTYDEQLDRDLPPGCWLVQLAIFDGSQVYQIDRAFEGMIEVDLAILELHEAIYAVGTLQYGHESSLLSRVLLTEAISMSFRTSRFAGMVSEFTRYPEARRHFDAESPLRAYEGVFVNVGEVNLLSRRCPIVMRISFDGVRGLTFDSFLIHRSYSRPENPPWVVVDSGRLSGAPQFGSACDMRRWEEVRDAN